jgi:hypothetical protein
MMNWISVKDKLPKNRVTVLIRYRLLENDYADPYITNDSGYIRFEAFYDKCWIDWCGDILDYKRITHWQPLPEPPKE